MNKLDRSAADFERTLDQLQAAFGAGVAPLELPIGEEPRFRGVADLLTDTAFDYEPTGRTHRPDAPRRWADLEHQVHDNAGRGHRRGRRRADGALPRGRRPQRRRARAHAGPQGVDGAVFPVLCGSAPPASASTAWPTSSARSAPSPADRPGRGERGTDRRGTPTPRPAAGVRVQDDRRPVRRPAVAVQGAVRARSRPTTSW